MVNKIFVGLFVIGLVYALFTGREEAVVDTILSSPKDAFLLFIEMYVLLVFWGGILEIMKDSGLLDKVSSVVSKILHPLFRRLPKDCDALKYISMNFVANMLSMGSAATPFGLKAMKELDILNNHSEVASDEMCTFLLINTSGLCLIPTSLLAIRNQFGSSNSASIVPWVLIISFLCTIASILLDIGGRKLAKR